MKHRNKIIHTTIKINWNPGSLTRSRHDLGLLWAPTNTQVDHSTVGYEYFRHIFSNAWQENQQNRPTSGDQHRKRTSHHIQFIINHRSNMLTPYYHVVHNNTTIHDLRHLIFWSGKSRVPDNSSPSFDYTKRHSIFFLQFSWRKATKISSDLKG